MSNRAVLLIVVAVVYLTGMLVWAQQQSPANINGCIVHTTTPVYADAQAAIFWCDVNGRLKVTTQ